MLEITRFFRLGIFVLELYLWQIIIFQGFGDTKFIPAIEKNRFEELLKSSTVWDDLEPLWTKLKDVIYDLQPGKTCLGYYPQGCTTYLSKNCTPTDSEKVQKWMKSENMECYNNRLFKTESNGTVSIENTLLSQVSIIHLLTKFFTLNSNVIFRSTTKFDLLLKKQVKLKK